MDERDRRRNILIIAGLILMLVLSIVAVYFSLFYEPSEEGEPPTFGEESGEREGGEDGDINNRANRGQWDDTSPRLVQITEEPVSGATAFLDDQDELVLRYAERQTSHIYDVEYETFNDERVSNETIPRVHEALFTANGDGVIFRYLDDNNATIRTYSADIVEREDELQEGQSPYMLEGGFLPNNITQIVLSPDRERIFWITATLREAFSFISDPDGMNRQDVFTSDFTEWLPQWVTSSSVSMTTKASGQVNGHSYTLNTNTGNLEKIAGISNTPGLTTLTNPDGTYIFYSGGTTDELQRSRVLNTETGEEEALFIRTIPEKCAWSPIETHMLYCGVPNSIPESTYPDIWYQGRVLFTDTIWEIDARSGDAREIYNPREEDRETLDVYRPFVTEDSSHLIFNNKHDMSLWSFKIEEGQTATPDQIPEGAPGI